MAVVSFKLYQRKLVVDDLSAMFYNSRGREREWDWRGVGRGVCVGGGGGGGEKGLGEQTDRQRFLHSEFICFSTVLQVTAVEVKPI